MGSGGSSSGGSSSGSGGGYSPYGGSHPGYEQGKCGWDTPANSGRDYNYGYGNEKCTIQDTLKADSTINSMNENGWGGAVNAAINMNTGDGVKFTCASEHITQDPKPEK